MKEIKFKDIFTEELAKGAILNELMEGFKEDYLVLHCLLRKYNPMTVFEIGTHIGTGTNIICNAVPKAVVYSLDLPSDLSGQTSQHPEHTGVATGKQCTFKYCQLYGDSLSFVYPRYVESFFIDGEHDYTHANHESKTAIKSGAKLIVWHDADMPEVYRGIMDAFTDNGKYELFRVIDTRIAFASWK